MDFDAAVRRKSSRTGGGQDDNCVEVAFSGAVVGVRDSKSPDSGTLVFSAVQWAFFLRDFRG
ncbi:DUF397 domain-containing protein [Lentzea sp. NPDC006480]|uniref:DUF397 domain-containing protein n=1 Tax=Lentzea sp. NPDC006480 TaxID=3157176 RepID=UPI0033AB8CCD